jgi:hypothetical protein
LSSLPTLADTVKLQVFGKTLHLIWLFYAKHRKSYDKTFNIVGESL